MAAGHAGAVCRARPGTAPGPRICVASLRRIIRACVEFKIKVLTIYAFSTENWRRPRTEVQALMKIFARVLDQETGELNRQGVCVHHLGDLTGIDPKLQEKVRRALELTRNNDRLILNVAFNYGGRAEILHAVRQMLADNIRPEDLSDSLFSSYLFTKGLPDPDLVIRTSGELRISNFLIWQAAYAEYYPTPALWPDFGRADLYEAVVAFNQRERRFGLVTDTTAPP